MFGRVGKLSTSGLGGNSVGTGAFTFGGKLLPGLCVVLGAGAFGPGADGPGADGPGADGPGADGPGADGLGADGPGGVGLLGPC